MYEELIKQLRTCSSMCEMAQFIEAKNLLTDAEAAITELSKNLRDCRNELCLKCGNYAQAHNGACDGCRWRKADA